MTDPLSAVGLLGLLSVCLDVTDKGFVLKDKKNDIRRLAFLLYLEAYLLARWAEHVGILQSDTNEDTSKTLQKDLYDAVKASLEEVLSLFKESSNLVAKHDKSANFEPIPKLPTALTKFSKATKLGNIATTPIRAFQWAIRDAEKFEQLVLNVGVLLQHLFNLIPQDQDLLKRQIHITLPDIPRADLEVVRELNFSSKDMNPNDAVRSTINFLTHSARIRSALPIWGVKQSLSSNGLEQSPVKTPDFCVSPPDHLAAWSTSIEIADGSQVPVMVEWRWTEQIAKASMEELLLFQHDVARLAKLLSLASQWSEYHILPFLGYFVDNDFLYGQHGPRYGLVFQLPQCKPNTTPDCRNLREAIKPSASSEQKPSIKARFHIARELVTAVFYLLTIGWHHKAIHSRNLYLLGEHSSGPVVKLLGFEYARPDEPGQRSLDPNNDGFLDLYRHRRCRSAARATQEYIEQGYCKIYDIYSVGVLLFEIGCWQSMENLKKRFDYERSKGAVVDDTLESYLAGRVKQDLRVMSPKYADITYWCLTADGSFQNGENDTPNIVAEFNDLVLQPLVSAIN
ncbi:hypothetical protein K4F52_007535 [Lecanicillium sp. MT-2017a]|nr:hypothetical protein K4F52_007535 [Lecanicillium sp. MT-2017a]